MWGSIAISAAGTFTSIGRKARNGTFTNYHQNGKVKSKIRYKSNKRHGQYVQYTEKGEITFNQLFANDELVENFTKTLTNEDKTFYALKYGVSFF